MPDATIEAARPAGGHTPIEAADLLAPQPASRGEATVDAWVRHYAAFALAAHAQFRHGMNRHLAATAAGTAEHGTRPDLGWMCIAAVHATSAAVALLVSSPDLAATRIYDLTPEAGALNGEWLDWLGETLDAYGINPADIDPYFRAVDFHSPSRQTTVSPAAQAAPAADGA